MINSRSRCGTVDLASTWLANTDPPLHQLRMGAPSWGRCSARGRSPGATACSSASVVFVPIGRLGGRDSGMIEAHAPNSTESCTCVRHAGDLECQRRQRTPTGCQRSSCHACNRLVDHHLHRHRLCGAVAGPVVSEDRCAGLGGGHHDLRQVPLGAARRAQLPAAVRREDLPADQRAEPRGRAAVPGDHPGPGERLLHGDDGVQRHHRGRGDDQERRLQVRQREGLPHRAGSQRRGQHPRLRGHDAPGRDPRPARRDRQRGEGEPRRRRSRPGATTSSTCSSTTSRSIRRSPRRWRRWWHRTTSRPRPPTRATRLLIRETKEAEAEGTADSHRGRGRAHRRPAPRSGRRPVPRGSRTRPHPGGTADGGQQRRLVADPVLDLDRDRSATSPRTARATCCSSTARPKACRSSSRT